LQNLKNNRLLGHSFCFQDAGNLAAWYCYLVTLIWLRIFPMYYQHSNTNPLPCEVPNLIDIFIFRSSVIICLA
jgi:hypothetical protein